MGDKRKIDMSGFNISSYAYKELEYFCMQYGEKKRLIKYGYGPKALRFTPVRVKGGISDSTFETANQLIKIKCDVEMIENAAKETDEQLYKYIIKNVTEGVPYEVLNVPCGRRQFYDKRKLFFYKLYCIKNKNV